MKKDTSRTTTTTLAANTVATGGLRIKSGVKAGGDKNGTNHNETQLRIKRGAKTNPILDRR